MERAKEQAKLIFRFNHTMPIIMETTTLKLYSLEYKEAKTYLMAALFIAGNIVFPQLCHTANMGGPTWLPIYLFTLVGAYKYGWRVGLLTAVASPFINSAWFGMPVPASLPAILLKSILFAGIAGYTAYRFQKVSIVLMPAVVLGYQLTGTLGNYRQSIASPPACQNETHN